MSWYKKMFGNRFYILAAFTFTGLLAALSQMPGIEITCSDTVVCDMLDCVAYCNVTNNNYRSVYLYNYDDWTMDFSPEVKDFKLYIKYYGKWRYTNFTMDTRLGNIPDSRKYVFVFPRKSTKQFKLVVNLSDADFVKYNFGELDPYLIGWDYICNSKLKKIPVYEKTEIEIMNECGERNSSCTKDWKSKEVILNVIRYDYVCPPGQRVGLEIGGVKHFGYINVDEEGRINEWNVPIGDRNFEEYGSCREYEEEKGVCSRSTTLKEVALKIEA